MYITTTKTITITISAKTYAPVAMQLEINFIIARPVISGMDDVAVIAQVTPGGVYVKHLSLGYAHSVH